ncbi:MAG: DUF421 domain-containing protein [Lactobacillus sp.]|jgi:uncharacterized membrane protein YcaP (DUF421 family)|nr:DUF421 domain-containing protein [Lactobacillus sp.]
MAGYEYYLWVGFKLLIGLVYVLVFLHYVGARRQFSQMTSLDLVSNFILCGLVGGFIYNHDISLDGFTMVMAIYFVIMFAVNYLTNKTWVGRKILYGIPEVIIQDGKLDVDKLKKSRLCMTDLMFLLRNKEIHSIKDVKVAQIEANGDITVVKKHGCEYALLLVDDGVVNTEALKQIKKDLKWLDKELAKKGINEYKDVFLAQWYNNELYVLRN